MPAITLTKATQPGTLLNNARAIGPGGNVVNGGQRLLLATWEQSTAADGYSTSSYDTYPGAPAYLKTEDGGLTYTVTDEVIADDRTFDGVTAFEVDGIGEVWLAHSYNETLLHYSHDRGATWNLATAQEGSISTSGLFFQNPVTGHLITNKKSFIGNNKSLYSVDGGINWFETEWSSGQRHFAGGELNGNPVFYEIQRTQTSQSAIVLRKTVTEALPVVDTLTLVNNTDYFRDSTAISSFAVGGNRVVVCPGGEGGGILPIWYSDLGDDTNFTRVDVPSNGGSGYESWQMVRWDEYTERFYATTNKQIFESEDGVTWASTFSKDQIEIDPNVINFSIGDIIPTVQSSDVVITAVVQVQRVGETLTNEMWYSTPVGSVEVELPPPTDDNDDGIDDSLQSDVPLLDLIYPARIGVILRSDNFTGVLNNLIDALNVSLPLLVDSDQAEGLGAPLNANLNRLTNLAPGTEDNDLVTLAQVKAALGIS